MLFDQSMGMGKQKVINPNSPAFWFSDFPLPRKSNLWKAFPSSFYFQPEKIIPLPSSSSFSYPNLLSTSYSPTYEEWARNLALFKKSGIGKVVLARKASFIFDAPVCPISLFHFLKQKSPNAFVFALILAPNLAFIGATPEKLFTRNGLKIITEAVAGTRTNSRAEELFSSEKDMKEFLFVKETLTDQLQKICNPFSISQNILIKKAGNVSHLHSNFSCTLKEQISDFDLVRLLHPTPAIGGFPRTSAMEFIKTVEPFDRGYYAGTVGLVSDFESKIYVGIRSCLIQGNQMDVFTGAGITLDSDPFLEWQELDHKQGLFHL